MAFLLGYRGRTCCGRPVRRGCRAVAHTVQDVPAGPEGGQVGLV